MGTSVKESSKVDLDFGMRRRIRGSADSAETESQPAAKTLLTVRTLSG